MDKFAFAARGEWFRQDGVTVVLVHDHEVLDTARSGDGKSPVWSMLTFPDNLTVCRYAILVRTLGSCEGSGRVVKTGRAEMGVVGEVVLVDRTF